MSDQGEHARVLFDALAAAGVRDVVISPGSRSTPFVHAAVTHPDLRCHEVLDERAAAFFAVGRAKVTGTPPVLLCTSGSAPAHYLPALVEATTAHVPLVVLTADRPLSLQSCGASQTTDQVKLYGDHVRWYADLGLPDGSVETERALRRTAAQAVLRARHPVPGPVHLNARADKPLEPSPSRRGHDTGPHVTASPPRLVPDDATLDAVAAVVRGARRGIVACGPAPLAQRDDVPLVVELCHRTGFALFAESTSQARLVGPVREEVAALDAFDLVLGSRNAAAALAPDVVVQLGAPPVSARWDAWLRDLEGVPRVVVAPHGWPDPQGTATHLVQAEMRATLEGLLGRLDGDVGDPEWVSHVRALDHAAWSAVRDVLREDDRSEGAMTRALVESLPEGALLAVGNSLPVRHLDAFCPGALADVRVWSQRGAAGIDGNVAGAAGAADAAGVPTGLLLGDLALLHDLSGLEVARRVRVPFAIVVLNNDGGRIFEQLPVARAATTAPHLARWTTPHGLGFDHAAALFGHRYARVQRAGELSAAVAEALGREGCTVIEAVAPPHGAVEIAARLRVCADEALAEVL